MTMAQDHDFGYPQIQCPKLEVAPWSFTVSQNKEGQRRTIKASLKHIGRYIKGVITTDEGSFSMCPRCCYLMTVLTLKLMGYSGLLS